jgi:hypothetical protein
VTVYSYTKRLTPLCLLDSVDLFTLYLSVISWYVNFSPLSKLSIAASASSIAPILVVLCRGESWGRSGA